MDEARELRARGIQLAKDGQKEQARQLLQQSIRIEPNNEAAWLWLASVARNPQERIFCLQKLLEINPNNETAIKALEAAGAQPPPGGIRALRSQPSAIPAAEQQAGVPVPPPDRIAEAQKNAEQITRDYLAPIPVSVNYVKKTRRRAGEGDIVVYRAYVAAGIAAVFVLLIGVFLYLLQTNDTVRAVVLGPSATPTYTPTVTPTNTPGITPTPSVTPQRSPTPSPSVPPNILAASPPALPRATAVYPRLLEAAVVNAARLLEEGSAPQARATLERERELNQETTFNPNIYYYEAIALAQTERYEEALAVLEEADERLGDRPEDIREFRPYLDAAYAQVYWLQAQNAPGTNPEALTLMRERAEAAIEGDPQLVAPYLILARDAVERQQFDDAIQVLNSGLNRQELNSNTVLVVERGEVYFAQGQYDRALYDAFLAQYIDPTNENAYELEIRIANARNRPGDAVLAAQDYLFYYPGSTRAFRLLGEAREAENKPDWALEVYQQGTAGRVVDDDVIAMLEAQARILEQLGRYGEAGEVYTRLFESTGEAAYQAARMQAALAAGEYDLAVNDAEALSGTDAVSEGVINLVRGRALVDTAAEGETGNYRQALTFLQNAENNPDIQQDPALLGTALEYIARAQLELRSISAALAAIDEALEVEETGSRYYWRGRILQAQGRSADAIAAYEYVLAWADVFDYPFADDAADRLLTLRG